MLPVVPTDSAEEPEIKRRTHVTTLFPNESSLLRLASAVFSEISDEWETERASMNMEAM